MGKLIIKMNYKSYYPENKDIKNLIAYIAGKGKNRYSEKVAYIGAYGVKKNFKKAAEQFIKMQNALGKAKKRRVYHMCISFEKDIDNPDIVVQAAKAIGEEIFKKYQVFFGVHTSTDNLHIHFAINAVSYVDGRKWHTSKPKFQEIKENILELVNDVMGENKLPKLMLYNNKKDWYLLQEALLGKSSFDSLPNNEYGYMIDFQPFTFSK